MSAKENPYPARLNIDYPNKMDRFSTFFRLFAAIPVLILISLLTSSGSNGYWHHSAHNGGMHWAGSVGSGLVIATALLILFRQRYPRWWFNYALELTRFTARVGAYLLLLTDRYPSTEDAQSVHVDVEYPDVKRDLNRWLPLFKWLLAIPHYVVLLFLVLGAIGATIIAWFAILFTGQYPKGLFGYVVGVGRWGLRVNAYAFLLVTDKYPPFSLS